MESGSDLEQRARTFGDLDESGCRLYDARDQLQQGRLAGAIAADKGDSFSSPNFQVHAIERVMLGVGAVVSPQQAEHVEEAVMRLGVKPIDLGEVDRPDDH